MANKTSKKQFRDQNPSLKQSKLTPQIKIQLFIHRSASTMQNMVTGLKKNKNKKSLSKSTNALSHRIKTCQEVSTHDQCVWPWVNRYSQWNSRPNSKYFEQLNITSWQDVDIRVKFVNLTLSANYPVHPRAPTKSSAHSYTQNCARIRSQQRTNNF